MKTADTEFEVAKQGGMHRRGPADSSKGSSWHNYIYQAFLIASIVLMAVTAWWVVHGRKFDIPISPTAIDRDNGVSYLTILPESGNWLFDIVTDNSRIEDQAKTKLFENDSELGPPHSLHDSIRSTGSGQFSHWGSRLYFAASDNSDPRINGRHYRALLTTTSPTWVLAVSGLCLLVSLYLNRRTIKALIMLLVRTMGVLSPLMPGKEIRWRWGVLAAVAMALLSLYPQIDLWITRGQNWQGSYASMFYDEEEYAAYINGLILGRPRRIQPLQVDLTNTSRESQFSLQPGPPYLLALLARMTGATVSGIFIVLTPLVASFATLMIFYLLAKTTGDERLAAVGTLVVLLLGTPASRDSVLFKWLLGRRVASGYLLFLRRYQPAASFPWFFVFISLSWHALGTEGGKTRRSAILSGMVLAAIVFSYFFLWTAAVAWLVCLLFIWLVTRPAEWRKILKFLIAMSVFAVPAFAFYAVMFTHRDRTMDYVNSLVFTHAPDFHRAPEWIAIIVILLLIWVVRRQRLNWSQPVVLLAGSLALTPFVVFNQQVITGRSLQSIHYEEFIANYLSLLALILTVGLFWHRVASSRWVANSVLLLFAVIALCWGTIEAHYAVGQHKYRNAERDRFLPVAKKLSVLATEHRQGSQDREVVFSPNIFTISDNVSTFAPQAPFWGTSVPYAAGLSWAEQQDRFFQYLYYNHIESSELERLLTSNDSIAVRALFGEKRYWSELAADFTPLTQTEIQARAREYAQYAASFNHERSLHPRLFYLVLRSGTPFDFSNLDRWYSHDIGQRIGPFTLYQLQPLEP